MSPILPTLVLFDSFLSGGCFELLPWSHKGYDLSDVPFAVDILVSVCSDRAYYSSFRFCSTWEGRGDTLLSGWEHRSSILLVSPASIIYFKLVRSQMMAGVVRLLSLPGFCSLRFTWFLKFFLLLIEILATMKKRTVPTLSPGTSRKRLWIILLSLLQEAQMCYTQVIQEARGSTVIAGPQCGPSWADILICLFCGFHYPGDQGINMSGITICGKLVKFWNSARTIQCLGWISWRLSKCMGCPLCLVARLESRVDN